MKQPTATTLAPLTAALAVAPPEILPTLTDPANTAAMVVVDEGMKTKSASRPYFLKSWRSLAIYQLALGESTELKASEICWA
jgi:hypothetical protein